MRMAHFLFIDESGHDRKGTPHEVLAGIAVEDRDLWNLIQAVRETELRIFGTRYSNGPRELKGRKLLKNKTFRLARQLGEIPPEERTQLARECLMAPATATRRHLTALAQAKLAYVGEVLDLCIGFHCQAFASVCTADAPRPERGPHLRKDYTYLFERFYYFVQDRHWDVYGAIVFDELEKTQSHILVDQMANYFLQTEKGRRRSSQIIPEPFFVHSDLTTGVQLADLVAYLVNWGYREPGVTKSSRPELDEFVESVFSMRYKTTREINSNPDFVIWSFALINDLRAQEEVEDE